jgi:hypothetical protein
MTMDRGAASGMGQPSSRLRIFLLDLVEERRGQAGEVVRVQPYLIAGPEFQIEVSDL